LSTDALAVIVGVALGLAASIPATAMIVYLLLRGRHSPDEGQRLPAYPPVVVINGSARAGYAAPPPLLPAMTAPAAGGRKWTVIGDAETGE
jgi:hypothetical protein